MTFNNLTQMQYERLLNTLARALHTQRRFVTLCGQIPLDGGKVAYSVKLRGFGYRVTLCGESVVEVAREVKAI